MQVLTHTRTLGSRGCGLCNEAFPKIVTATSSAPKSARLLEAIPRVRTKHDILACLRTTILTARRPLQVLLGPLKLFELIIQKTFCLKSTSLSLALVRPWRKQVTSKPLNHYRLVMKYLLGPKPTQFRALCALTMQNRIRNLRNCNEYRTYSKNFHKPFFGWRPGQSGLQQPHPTTQPP